MPRVLHITPHLGGGVGRVLRGALEAVLADRNRAFEPEVISLEYANDQALDMAARCGLRLRDRMSDRPDEILAAVASADVVVVHFWNHPLLQALLVRHALPPARIVFWSHVSGFHAPYVFPDAALAYPDRFVLTTPISRTVPEVAAFEIASGCALPIIWSTGGIAHVEEIVPVAHPRFTVGYLGTVDYAKLHPRFLQMSARIALPDAEWVVCGGPNHHALAEQARAGGWAHRFRFEGPVTDISSYLARFDVFGYPLSPEHYGTCEQALVEAMAAGVPPVVLANRAERTIVDDGVSGIIATSEDEYVRAVEALARDDDLRRRLSSGAREAARRRFSLSTMVSAWDRLLREVLSGPKRARSWSGAVAGPRTSAAQLFCESLGVAHGQAFRATVEARTQEDLRVGESLIMARHGASHAFRSRTRGTPHHYRKFFPEDAMLRRWSALLPASEA